MSEVLKINLTRMGVLLGVVLGAVSLARAFYVSPDRVGVIERRVTLLEEQVASSRELLVRIDENVKALKEARK